jgi:hemin uptake protein HemP
MVTPETRKNPGGAAKEEERASALAVRSEELLRGRRELQIVHDGSIYRLLLTRDNKLILQK